MRQRLGQQVQPEKYICLCVYECVYVCVYSKVYMHTCAHMCVHVCAIFHVLEVNWARSEGALRTARERNHTHSHKQSNQFVYQTRHLMVICECV